MRLFTVLLVIELASGAEHWTALQTAVSSEQIRGGATAGAHAFFTWGDQLRLWSTTGLTSRVVAAGPFGEGGCTTDLDGDGKREVVSVRGTGKLGSLLWFRPDHQQPEQIDDEVEMHDCLDATLFGRRGLLMIQRGIQIRFYERGEGKWRSRDVYSIYTPSYQTGLALADVDGDGNTDILCGNYWVRSPEKWEESWRIFAINTWSEKPEAAMFRIVGQSDGSGEFVAQGHGSPARFAAFTRTADPRQQWEVRLLAESLAPFTSLHGLARVGGILIAGEHNGSASRLIAVRPESGAGATISTGHDTLVILPMSSDSFLTIEPDRVTSWGKR